MLSAAPATAGVIARTPAAVTSPAFNIFDAVKKTLLRVAPFVQASVVSGQNAPQDESGYAT
jgi:hypothetical protein